MSRHHESIKNDPRWHRARRDCIERDGHRCVRCGADDDLQADHITPLDAGGAPFDLDNLQTLCGPCNRIKSNRIETRLPWFNPKWLAHL